VSHFNIPSHTEPSHGHSQAGQVRLREGTRVIMI
jgi:hypothetical protein